MRKKTIDKPSFNVYNVDIGFDRKEYYAKQSAERGWLVKTLDADRRKQSVSLGENLISG